jgi:hypothetical protein
VVDLPEQFEQRVKRGEEADFRYGGKDYCCECLTEQLEKDGVIEEILE